MKIIKLLLVILIIVGCKEKTFADEIVLSFPKNTEIKIQDFNSDGNDFGTNLIYIGKLNPKIEVKYYKNIIPEPPPPPKFNESKKDLIGRLKKYEDSLSSIKSSFFYSNYLKLFDSDNTFFIDSLSNQNLQIIVKEKDTIPLYKRVYDTNEIRQYKAFPIFIKNISDKTLHIPIDASTVAFYVHDDSLQQFYFLKNNNYMVCEMGTNNYPYFELKPNEILIYSFPHLEKGNKRKGKIVFFKASSKEFDISINEKIILNQRNTHFLQ